VAQEAEAVASKVTQATIAGHFPVVIGGDCSVAIGAAAALRKHHGQLALAYFDGDVDLNTPDTSTSGRFDGMVLAHLLGMGAKELTGPTPVLAAEDLLLYGYDAESGRIDPPELVVLADLAALKFPASRVLECDKPASEALKALEDRGRPFLIHFDVDVMDFPAADAPNGNGLSFEAAHAAVATFLNSESCVGLVIAELNPEQDPGGSHIERFTKALVELLAPA
jgi:arginase